MRSFLIALAVSSVAVAAPAAADTRNFGISGFDRVRVDGPYRVTLATGVAPFARARGSARAIDHVAIDVRGNTLVIHSNLSGSDGDTGRDRGPVEIIIGTHDLAAAWLNGAGMLTIDHVKELAFDLSVQGSGAATIGAVSVDQLTVSILGTASATMSGKAASMTAVVRGISNLDASGLAVKDAKLGAEGAATIKANITDAVTIDGSGPASIVLTGRPSCTLRLNGSTSVEGCR